MELKRNVFWNTFGTVVYLAAQWLTTILIVRITNNYEDAGLYSLAMSVSNVFYMIAIYNVRNFQVSDINEEYKNEDYVFHRVAVMTIALVTCILFVVITYSDKYTMGVLIFYMVYRLGESYVDVLHGIDQRLDRLDIVGKSYMMRGIIMLITFSICEIITGNILITIIAMSICSFIAISLYDVRQTHRIAIIPFKIELDKIKKLFIICFPLLIYGIALNMQASIPRIITEKLLGKELLGYYASVATPAVIVQSFASVIFAPFITTFTRYYQEKNLHAFKSLAIKMLGFCVGLGFVAYWGSFFLGDFVLDKILYAGKGIGSYCYLLDTTMICTALVAIIWFIAILLTIDRGNLLLSISAIVGVIAEIILGYYLIDRYNLDGINWSLIISYLIVIIVMGIGAVIRLDKHFKEEE